MISAGLEIGYVFGNSTKWICQNLEFFLEFFSFFLEFWVFSLIVSLSYEFFP